MDNPKTAEMKNQETELDLVENMDVEVKVPCEVYSRVVGYLRPVQNWNAGKSQEFSDRKTFKNPVK